MIQASVGTSFNAYIQTEDNRIDTSVPVEQIRLLFAFTNIMDKSVQYAYPALYTINNRYTYAGFSYSATPNVFDGSVNLIPAGFYNYEVYEVSWAGSSVVLDTGTAPTTPTEVLTPAANTKGVVKGLVTKGLLNLENKGGTGQVQYTEHPEPSGTNYIYYGQ